MIVHFRLPGLLAAPMTFRVFPLLSHLLPDPLRTSAFCLSHCARGRRLLLYTERLNWASFLVTIVAFFFFFFLGFTSKAFPPPHLRPEGAPRCNLLLFQPPPSVLPDRRGHAFEEFDPQITLRFPLAPAGYIGWNRFRI